uniref:replication initiation factor domain-containing protein n=1 Tax=Mediterraneibacter faecis TaxID=592978 RepID=UPI0022E3FE07
IDGGVMKRIDLAINDHTGILDIPELAEKCRKREYIGKSRSYKFYQSGELIKHREDDREYMGADIINRFEIRLRNERAYYAVRDLLTYYDAEQTAFSIINQYVRFVDEEPDKRKNDWKLNDRWAWFIGDNRQSLKLTTKPEPYTLDRTLRWVQRQVAPTLKMLKKIDKGNGTDYMETIEQQAKLTEKHEMIIKQQTTPAKDLVES